MEVSSDSPEVYSDSCAIDEHSEALRPRKTHIYLTGKSYDNLMNLEIGRKRAKRRAKDVEELKIRVIYGKRDPDAPPLEQFKGHPASNIYYAGIRHMSDIHNEWICVGVTPLELVGKSCIAKLNERSTFVLSKVVPHLLVPVNKDLDPDWFQIDRVIDECEDEDKHQFLIKWKSLPYSRSTWEDDSVIEDFSHIDRYLKRLDHSNPIKFPSNVPPRTLSQYKPIPKSLIARNNFKLRDYQVEGVNWLLYCYYSKKNSILADEMGLGKTAQVVTTLSQLSKNGVNGPFLVIVPLSTLSQWQNEFDNWSNFYSVVYHGDEKSMEVIEETEFVVVDRQGRVQENRVQFDALITSYDVFNNRISRLSKIHWEYMVIDEAHRLKNLDSLFFRNLRKLKYHHVTLLTGTPIQNNLSELFSLLNFLYPDEYNDLDSFLERFSSMGKVQVSELQELIQPIMLRRQKAMVEKSILPKEETIIEVTLTHTQRNLYKTLLSEQRDLLISKLTNGTVPKLKNLLLELRKVCNHPFLLKGIEGSVLQNKSELDSLILASGKLMLMDKLLPKLEADKKKVLVFSQWTKMLDIIDDYLTLKGYKYARIDGNTPKEKRQGLIDAFNRNGFIFLISTKAGGTGINLTSADTVILHDSDWNPQNDLQAIARCHRIGQMKVVKVYRLITKDTYETQMFDRSSMKLGFDKALLEGSSMYARQIEGILRSGIQALFSEEADKDIDNFCNEDIDQILSKRARVFTSDIITGGDSIWAKAKYSPGDVDESREFWAKFLPENVKEDVVWVQNPRERLIDTNYSANQEIVNNLVNFGFRDREREREILSHAIKFVELKDAKERAFLERLECMPADVEELGGASTFYVRYNAKRIVKSVFFFERVKNTLMLMQDLRIRWPRTERLWQNPLKQYQLLFDLYQNGMSAKKGWPRISKMKEILGKIMDEVEGESLRFAKAVKIDTPQEWADKHSFLAYRIEVTPEEIENMFNTIRNDGIPLLPSGEYDCNKLMSKLEIMHTAKSDFLNILKTFLNFFSHHEDRKLISIDTIPFPRLKILEKYQISDVREAGRVTNNFISIQRAVYGGSYRLNPLPNPPRWWNYKFDKAFLQGLVKHGLSSNYAWLDDPELPFSKVLSREMIQAIKKEGIHGLKTRDERIEKGLMMTSQMMVNIKPGNATQFCLISIGVMNKERAMSNDNFVFPDGFETEKVFSFPKGNRLIGYRVEVDSSNNQVFKVFHKIDGGLVYEASTPAAAWDGFLEMLEKEEGPGLRNPNKKTSGPMVFGGLAPVCSQQIMSMRRNARQNGK